MLTSKYLNFHLFGMSPTGKTKIVSVQTKDDSFVLGQIKWHGAWRKYCFFPSNNCLFDQNCLNDITEYIDFLMNERK